MYRDAKLVKTDHELHERLACLQRNLRVVLCQFNLEEDWCYKIVVLVLVNASRVRHILRVGFQYRGPVLIRDLRNERTLSGFIVDAKVDDFEDLVHGFASIFILRTININTLPVLICRE